MFEVFIDFIAAFVMEAIIGLPALPRDSADWKARRKHFLLWFIVAAIVVGTVLVLTVLNTYGLI
jgi:hypothetical protein